MSKPIVLILGATGLFGGLLAQRLIKQARFDVVCAGRNKSRLKTFCATYGGRYKQLNRDDTLNVTQVLDALKPFAVVDCAGPFQAYGDAPYKFAEAVINTGCHYLDIADASSFVRSFETLDALAKSKNSVALSGASSTPAISSSVADYLTRDLATVHSITTVIIPGNQAKRTLSVMRSILSQIGKPMKIKRHGINETIYGWAETESFNLDVWGKKKIKGRLASFVNTPDIAFFGERYNAQSVAFKAGLELKIFHYALVVGRWFVSRGIIKSLEPFAPAFRWLASWFESVGSDEGGMKVSVLGSTVADVYERREWDLIADDGNGPNIPTLPVSILLNRILDGNVAVGARACLGEMTLDELDAALDEFDGRTQIHQGEVKGIFKQVLGESFEALPKPVSAFHKPLGRHVYAGKANIKGPTGLLGNITSFLIGFPKTSSDIPVKVTITGDEKSEVWLREFDGKPFHSHLSLDKEGFIQERFGPLSIRLGLEAKAGKLLYPVVRGRLFGVIPFPTLLLPQSISHEEVDEEGRFVFDVLIKFRFGGRIAHYQGWLVKQD